jgi:hypothetical protein
MCNQCKENELKLQMDRQTNRQTAAEQYALPSSKGGIISVILVNSCKNLLTETSACGLLSRTAIPPLMRLVVSL